MPLTQLRVVKEDKIIVGYSRTRMQFVFIRRSETHSTLIDRLKLDTKEEYFGECS